MMINEARRMHAYSRRVHPRIACMHAPTHAPCVCILRTFSTVEEILREAQTRQGAVGGTRTVVATFLLSILLSTCLQRLSNHLSFLILNVSLPCLATLAAVFDSLYLLSVITACVRARAPVCARDTGIFVQLLPNKSKVEA